MTLDESRKSNDMVIESQGVKIVYETDLEDYVKDSVVDYSNGWFDKGFVLRGARTSTC
jgi:Fe-S cluster assembly iron-binding protein IscA